MGLAWLSRLISRASWASQVLRTRVLYGPFLRDLGRRSAVIKPIMFRGLNRISIGSRVSIRNGCRIEIVDDGVNNAALSIGDNVNIEQNVHIVCHSSIRIGSNVSITANCVIVDTVHPFDDVSNPIKIGQRLSTEPSFVEIGDGCFIGTGVAILPNVRIGEGSVIGSNSVVTRDIPPYSVAAGQPARVLRSRIPSA